MRNSRPIFLEEKEYMKEKKKMGLGVRILLGMVLGIIVGAIL